MLRKIIFILLLIWVLSPTIILAATPTPSVSVAPTPSEGIIPRGSRASIPDPLRGTGIQNVVTAAFNIAYAVAGIVAIAYLIVGGYQYITSQGNPDVAAQAKGTITNSIVGLIIILTSYLIIHFALSQLHASGIL